MQFTVLFISVLLWLPRLYPFLPVLRRGYTFGVEASPSTSAATSPPSKSPAPSPPVTLSNAFTYCGFLNYPLLPPYSFYRHTKQKGFKVACVECAERPDGLALLEKVLHRNMQYSNDMPAAFETTPSEVSLPGCDAVDSVPSGMEWMLSSLSMAAPPPPPRYCMKNMAASFSTSSIDNSSDTDDDNDILSHPHAPTPFQVCAPGENQPRERDVPHLVSHINALLQHINLPGAVEENRLEVDHNHDVEEAVTYWGGVFARADDISPPVVVEPPKEVAPVCEAYTIAELPGDCIGVIAAYLTMSETLQLHLLCRHVNFALSADVIWGRYFAECYSKHGESRRSAEKFFQRRSKNVVVHDLLVPAQGVLCVYVNGWHPADQYTAFARPCRLLTTDVMPQSNFKSAFLREQQQLSLTVSACYHANSAEPEIEPIPPPPEPKSGFRNFLKKLCCVGVPAEK